MASRPSVRQHKRLGLSSAHFDLLEARQLLAAVSVDVVHPTRSIGSGYAGTNLAYWQYELGTAKLQQMVRDAGVRMFRLPGGSAADEFHFTDRPPYNGYDSVPVLAKAIEAMNGDAIVTVDYGSGSPQEAAALLAYLNANVGNATAIGVGGSYDKATGRWLDKDWKTAGYWASLRAATPLAADDGLNFLRVGHRAPWGFSHYEIGNEEYATWEADHHSPTGRGGTSPSDYVGFAKSFATLAAGIDAHVQIGIDVSPALRWNMPNANWTRDLLAQSAAQGFTPGFLSDHAYMTGLSDQKLLLHSVNDPAFKMDSYQASWSARATFYRTLLNQTLGTKAPGVKLMVTEFNSDIGNKQATNLVGGLWLADALGGLMQTEYTAGLEWDLMNGYNALASPDASHYGWREGVDEGLIGTGNSRGPTSGAYVPYPMYFADQLFTKLTQDGGAVLPVTGDDANLSTYAVREANGHVRLLVINKSATNSITGTFGFGGFTAGGTATQWQYGTAEDTAQSQTSDGHSALTTTTFGVGAGGLSRSFTAYSMSVIDVAPAPVVVVVVPPTGPLAGTAIGTAGSFGNSGNTIARAFDNDLGTYFDAPSENNSWVGLDLGTATAIGGVKFAPRPRWGGRMVGGIFQGSNSATFGSGVVTLGTIAAAPADGVMTSLAFSNAAAFRYVRYLAPSGFGNVAELQFLGSSGGGTTTTPPATHAKLAGTGIGTAGSIGGNTFANALDGDLNTYVDSTTINGAWVGLDLGVATVIGQIAYAPRDGLGRRMVGGRFEGSDRADFGDATTLLTLAAAPPDGVWTTATIANANRYRYVRYLAPAGSFGNVADVAFYG